MALSRYPADSNFYAIRRICPRPDYWRPHPDNSLEYAAFSDKGGEVSLMLHATLEKVDCDAAKARCRTHIEEKGFGLCNAKVGEINNGLKTDGHDGLVVHDPLPEFENHGVITGSGDLSQEKRECLARIFQNNVCVIPDAQKYTKYLEQNREKKKQKLT
jgi:hypothetical protein